MGVAPQKLFNNFEYDAFAAATIGQVHRAEDKKGRPLAVKIQYSNILRSIDSNLTLLKTLAGSFLRKFDIYEHLDEMKLRLLEETDYCKRGKILKNFINDSFLKCCCFLNTLENILIQKSSAWLVLMGSISMSSLIRTPVS